MKKLTFDDYYNQGWNARVKGKSIDDNPYPNGGWGSDRDAWATWNSGYWDCQYEEETGHICLLKKVDESSHVKNTHLFEKFLTKNEVAPYAEEYLKELYDIRDYYIKSLEGHEDFITDLFGKSKSCTNPSRKVVLIADPNLDMTTIARAKLQHIDNSYDTAIIIYFCPIFWKSLKNLKKMFEVAEQFIWHEATHLARMDILGTDESHEPDISDIEYLGSPSELNAFAIQSLVANPGEDLAAELYDISDELAQIFEDIKSKLEHSQSNESLEESTNLTESRAVDRTSKQDVIGPYTDYYKEIKYLNTLNKYFEKEDLPYECLGTHYEDSNRTLTIHVAMYLKAYGDSYSREYTYNGERSPYTANEFSFDNDLSGDEAEILFPLGLVKTGKYYPTSCFHYSDYAIGGKPMKLHWVDHIILQLNKEYD